MTDLSASATAEQTAPRRRALTVLRVASVAFLFDTLLQAALAGLFITGDVRFLDLHAANAQLLAALSVLEAVAALVVWRSLKGPAWPFTTAVGLVVLVAAQMGLGAARMLGGHVPLALAVFGAGTVLAWWSCTYRGAEGGRG